MIENSQGTIGIDFGGTGTKAAVVDVNAGTLVTDRHRIPTPHPATPQSMVPVMAELVAMCGSSADVGVTVPAVVQGGTVRSAANIDPEWIGVDAAQFFTEGLGQRVTVINDADAAGLAEVRHGAGVGRDGVVLLLTLGTGIGSALFVDGNLVPNTEFGHLELAGKDAEKYAAGSIRSSKDLSWKKWGKRVNKYLQLVEKLMSPELIIIGGGVSKKSDKYFKYFEVDAEVVPAVLKNGAGIVGAAMAAHENRLSA